MTPLERTEPETGRISPWVVVAFWTVYGVISVNQSVLWAEVNNRPVMWARILAFTLCICVTWLIFTPIVIWATRRFPLVSGGWQRNLIWHVPLALLMSAGAVKVDMSVLPHFDWNNPAGFLSQFLQRLDMNVFYYAVIVASVTSSDLYHLYRERHRKASELHTELVTAKLEALKMQLQPHFLFNTLNAINALIHEDTEAADRMVTRLADLLRLTLYETRHEVPLAKELEFISAYVEIQQIRFQNRLSVDFEVKGAVLGAVVPSLVLQPLVENAIRHGVAPRSRAGHVWIRARRENAELVLEVEDDGVGMRGPADARVGGIGLQNTRARLQQLYAAQHELLISSVEQRGTLVRITLPYVEAQEFADDRGVTRFNSYAGV